MLKWHIEKRLIKDLKPHPSNPRKLSKHDAENLQKSLEKFGIIDKPIITQNGLIIGGHQRLSILKKMGHNEIECYVPNQELDEKDINELNIRLNRNIGEWDWDILANQWNLDDLFEWGFTPEECAIADIESVELEDENESENQEPITDPKSKLGDIYILDRHRLVCGDSTNGDSVNLCLGEDFTPILMVTDPPYGVNYDPNWRGIAGKGKKATGKVLNDDRVNWALAWHLFPGSIAYVWHAAWFTSEVHKSLNEAEFDIISQIIWHKQHFSLSRGDYHWHHEPCWYAVKKGHNHNWQGARDQSTIWKIANLNAFGGDKKKDSDDERTNHSTQKPLECMARPIINNTSKGEVVYDPFLGSGTTLLACEKLDRICFGLELDPIYCDMIVQRWIKYRRKNNKDYTVLRNSEICEDLNVET